MVAHPSTDTKPSKKDLKDNRWPEGNTFLKPASSKDHLTNNVAEQTCIYHICEVLKDAGLPVARLCPTNPTAVAEDAQKHGGSIRWFENTAYRVWNSDKIGFGEETRYSYWYVSPESLMTSVLQMKRHKKRPKVVRGYEWYAVEVSSPIICDPFNLQTSLPLVQTAGAALKRSSKLWVNSQCGFHIHASPAATALRLRLARRVVALTYILEHSFIYRICHPCRKTSGYTRPISRMSQIALGNYGYLVEEDEANMAASRLSCARNPWFGKEVENSKAIVQALRVILSCGDMASLAQGLSISQFVDYSDALDGVPRPTGGAARGGLAISQFGTIEFRYPEGTVDADYIAFWAALVRSIFAIGSLPTEEFVDKLLELFLLAISKSKKDIVEWLGPLNLLSSMSYVKGRMHNNRTCHKNFDKTGIVPEEKDEDNWKRS